MDDLARTVFSLALLGESEVGKTSLIMRLCNNEFNEHELSTVGKESHMYPVKLHGHDMKIKIFDTAGQERFRSLIVKTFKIAEAIMLVYSIGNKRSFNQLDEWLRELSQNVDTTKIPIIIIGNKSDLDEEDRVISYDEGKNYAEKKGYHFYETSVKNNKNISECFNDIFEQLYKIYEPEIVGNTSKIENVKLKKKKTKKKGC